MNKVVEKLKAKQAQLSQKIAEELEAERRMPKLIAQVKKSGLIEIDDYKFLQAEFAAIVTRWREKKTIGGEAPAIQKPEAKEAENGASV